MEIRNFPNGDQSIHLQTEADVRAVALSFGAVHSAIREKQSFVDAGWFERQRTKRLARKLEQKHRAMYSTGALRDLIIGRGEIDSDEFFYGTITTVENSTERKLLSIGANLLLKKELQSFEAQNNFFSHPITQDGFEQKHRYGGGFMPAVRQLSEI